MTNLERNPGGRRGRGVVERVNICGTLVLETPAHLGGEGEGVTDMPLLRDALDGKTPLLTGTSIAGALRSYVHEYLEGYGQPIIAAEPAAQLFGAVDDKTGMSLQSWLVVDDALGSASDTDVELRDGVALKPETRTAEEDKKFDMELLPAGTRFSLSFELLLTEDNQEMLPLLILALRGLEEGEIGLGSRKRRGLGQCRASGWRVRRFDLTVPRGLIAWLEDDESDTVSGNHIAELVPVQLEFNDRRESFTLHGTFELASSLLIRSSSGATEDSDMIYLHSSRDGDGVPILSGTSLAGAVRARALRIANTLLGGETGVGLVNDMFGMRIGGSEDLPSGSRILTRETIVNGKRDLVHGRVKIDRFTAGAYPQALFFQQPVFGGNNSQVEVLLELRQPREHEIGLLLLVLKDLWTGDLPLGGESSVGRGRLRGKHVSLAMKGKEANTWELTRNASGGLAFDGDGERQKLEDFVTALRRYEGSKSR